MAPSIEINGTGDHTSINQRPSKSSQKFTHATGCMPWIKTIPEGLKSFFSKLRHSKNSGETVVQYTNGNGRNSDDVGNENRKLDTIKSLQTFSFSDMNRASIAPSHLTANQSNDYASTPSPVNNGKRRSTYKVLKQRLSYNQKHASHETSTSNTEECVVYKQGKYAKAPSRQLQSKLGSLPPELLLPIFEQLPGKDLVRMGRVCQRFGPISTEVLNGKSNGARDARSRARDAVKEDITRLVDKVASPAIFEEELEKLIGRHRDIGVAIETTYLKRPVYFDILLSVLAKQTHVCSLAVCIRSDALGLERIISTLATIGSNFKLHELHARIECRMTPAQTEMLAGVRPLTSITIGAGSDYGYRTLQTLLANPTTTCIELAILNVYEGYADWALVKRALADNKTIEKLWIKFASDEALAVIAPALDKHTSLETLILDFSASVEFRVGSIFGSRAGAARRSEPLMRRLKPVCWSMADSGRMTDQPYSTTSNHDQSTV